MAVTNYEVMIEHFKVMHDTSSPASAKGSGINTHCQTVGLFIWIFIMLEFTITFSRIVFSVNKYNYKSK